MVAVRLWACDMFDATLCVFVGCVWTHLSVKILVMLIRWTSVHNVICRRCVAMFLLNVVMCDVHLAQQFEIW